MSAPPAGARRIAAVVLAAGASTRFGTPKQLLVHRGESLVRRAALAALDSGAAAVVVVLGADAERISSEVAGLPSVTTAINDEWASGIASSLAAGLRAVSGMPECDGVLVTLADQPRVDAPSLGRLLAAFDEGHRVVASEYDNTIGVPAVFGVEHLGELMRLSGDRGAGQWLREKGAAVRRVPMQGASADVDTPADAARLLSVAALALAMLLAAPSSAKGQTSCCEPVRILTSRTHGLAKVPEYLRIWIEPQSRIPGWQPGLIEEVHEAFGMWARAELPVIFEFTEDSSQANLRVYWRSRFREAVTGRSTWWVEGRTFTHGEIEIALNTSTTPLEARLVRAIAMHEIGHLLGLSHSSDPRSIMTFYVSAPELSARDIARAKALFKP